MITCSLQPFPHLTRSPKATSLTDTNASSPCVAVTNTVLQLRLEHQNSHRGRHTHINGFAAVFCSFQAKQLRVCESATFQSKCFSLHAHDSAKYTSCIETLRCAIGAELLLLALHPCGFAYSPHFVAMPKTVLITGGSSGVGAELVSLFAERGYVVWFTYNSGRQRADKLLESLPKDCSAQVTWHAQESSSSLACCICN